MRLTKEEIYEERADGWNSADDIILENGKRLKEYYDDDEFYTDGLIYIPIDEWKDFAEEGIVIAFFQEEKLWADFWEYLDLEKNIVCGYGIQFTQEQIYDEMLDFINEDGINDYFEFARRYE